MNLQSPGTCTAREGRPASGGNGYRWQRTHYSITTRLGPIGVDALAYGPLGIHREPNGYVVDHIESGRVVASFDVQEQAKRFVEEVATAPEWKQIGAKPGYSSLKRRVWWRELSKRVAAARKLALEAAHA